jgi:hypothetical protein
MHPGRGNHIEDTGVGKMALRPDLALSCQGEVVREKREESALWPVHRTTKERKREREKRVVSWPRSAAAAGAFVPEFGRHTMAGSCLEPLGRGSKSELWGGCVARGATASAHRSAARHSHHLLHERRACEEWCATIVTRGREWLVLMRHCLLWS